MTPTRQDVRDGLAYVLRQSRLASNPARLLALAALISREYGWALTRRGDTP